MFVCFKSVILQTFHMGQKDISKMAELEVFYSGHCLLKCVHSMKPVSRRANQRDSQTQVSLSQKRHNDRAA